MARCPTMSAPSCSTSPGTLFRPSSWTAYEFVLSFEVGAVKPDPKIFSTALERLGGVDAADAGCRTTASIANFGVIPIERIRPPWWLEPLNKVVVPPVLNPGLLLENPPG